MEDQDGSPIGSPALRAQKERGILFKGEMVRAILDGRKTQTRRIVKEPIASLIDASNNVNGRPALQTFDYDLAAACPYGQTGDRLWVRETWSNEGCACYEMCACPSIWYRADMPAKMAKEDQPRWRPSLLMPRWASRITLEITNIRAERLQDITEADAKAEGTTAFPYDPEGDCWTDGKYKTAYEFLWNEINGWEPNAWNLNPWVWVVEFRRIEASEAKPADQREAEPPSPLVTSMLPTEGQP